MTLRTAAGVVIALLVLPDILAADPGAIRQEFEISTDPRSGSSGYGYAGEPHDEGHYSVDIAGSADGTFVVVWEDLYTYQNGYYGRPNPGIWARRIDDVGRPLGPEFRVSDRGSFAKGSAHVASNAASQFVVVWDDEYADPDHPYSLGIRARRFGASGSALGLPFTVSTHQEYEDYFHMTPKVGLDDAGRFMVVWSGYRDVSSISGRVFNSGGMPLGGEFQVNSEDLSLCCYTGFESPAAFDELNIAASNAGTFMVVWAARDEADGDEHVRGRVFDASGTPLGPDLVVSDQELYWGFPNVAADGAGRFIVVWTDVFGEDVRARRFDATGASLGPSFAVNTEPRYGLGFGPGVAADSAGGFVVTWGEFTDGYRLSGRKLDAAGVPIGGEFRIDEPNANYDDAPILNQKVAASAAGDFIVAWGQVDESGDYVVGVVGRALGNAPTPCTPAPKAGCRATSKPRSGLFTFRERSNPAQSTLGWKLVRGTAADPSAFGDPTETDSYSFCVYDGSARPQPLFEAAVPADGACGKVRCWTSFPVGRLDYFDPQREVNGIELIRVLPGAEGRSRAEVKGRGERLALPDLPLTVPVTVQLQVANGDCWSATYAGQILRNADGTFKAKPDL
jgi:hypothetical protein